MSDEPRRSLEECPECGGAGCLPEHPDVAPSGEIRCPRCEGVGRLGVNPECELCDGRGVIPDCPACLAWDGDVGPDDSPRTPQPGAFLGDVIRGGRSRETFIRDDQTGRSPADELRRLREQNTDMRAMLKRAETWLRAAASDCEAYKSMVRDIDALLAGKG